MDEVGTRTLQMLRWRGSNSTVREVVPNKEGAVQHQVPPSHRASRKWPRQAGIGALALVLVVYVVVPLLFYASPWLRRQTVFLTFVNLPPFPRLNKPESYGLGCPHNFYLDSDIGIRLGAWHLPPQSAVASHPCDQLSPDWFGHDDRPIVLYLHGNGGSRAGGHRLHLYQVSQTSFQPPSRQIPTCKCSLLHKAEQGLFCFLSRFPIIEITALWQRSGESLEYTERSAISSLCCSWLFLPGHTPPSERL